MVAVLDFGALPPELNSGRMYAGPGSESMLAAAAAWDGLAAELHSVASTYNSVISALTSGPWRGPASASTAAASAPYATWMSAMAAQAEQAGAQARDAADAYHAAFAMTVPPAVVAANRAQLATLTATNFFGINSPAIAANEAQYAEMWAQDALAMYGYAANSAVATQLTPFTSPPQTTNTAGLASQGAAVAHATGAAATQQSTLSPLISAIPNALQQLSSPATSTSSSTGVTTPWGSVIGGSGSSGLSGIMNDWPSLLPGYLMVSATPLYALSSVLGMAQTLQGLTTAGAWEAAEGAAGALESGIGNTGVLAGVGQAASLGPLSVPPSWGTSVQTGMLTSAGAAMPGTGANPLTGTPPSVLGGLPRGAASGPGSSPGPRYGSVPTVMARPPSAGYGGVM
ncbi:PPE family protein [Mycobacterium branderi]|uniref:PPE family protein n=1 Tax=Mycobacterium branderi TaxID=43348 RepID=A0ABN6B7L3_9MYCO|nr:PPE family protein [Mycobacterium branderi]MCV7235697.1 PPE family protein [Mycobacterium branderi]BBZ12424.1 PPE family protein [Mycobacterium branderi]